MDICTGARIALYRRVYRHVHGHMVHGDINVDTWTGCFDRHGAGSTHPVDAIFRPTHPVDPESTLCLQGNHTVATHIHMLIHMLIHMPLHMHIRMSVKMSIHTSIHMSICLPVRMASHLQGNDRSRFIGVSSIATATATAKAAGTAAAAAANRENGYAGPLMR